MTFSGSQVYAQPLSHTCWTVTTFLVANTRNLFSSLKQKWEIHGKKHVEYEKIRHEYMWAPRTTENDDLRAVKFLFLFISPDGILNTCFRLFPLLLPLYHLQIIQSIALFLMVLEWQFLKFPHYLFINFGSKSQGRNLLARPQSCSRPWTKHLCQGVISLIFTLFIHVIVNRWQLGIGVYYGGGVHF